MARTGRYRFMVYDFGRLHPHRVTVTIVEETAKRYRIRIPCVIGSHAPGDTMWVMKKSVEVDSAPCSPQGGLHGDVVEQLILTQKKKKG